MANYQQQLTNVPPVKILVVDDREDNLFSIETILEKGDCEVVKANSGRAALKILLQQQDFSLILMDVQMPVMNGFETASLIYERDKLRDIPIIFITAHSSDENYMFKGYKAGGVDYIYKPINPELLKLKVGVFVELYRKNQQLLLNEKQLIATNAALQKEIEEKRISEQKIKVLNEELVKNNSHLKAVNEELDRFAFVASHDLQEPLRKIMIFSDTLYNSNAADAESGRHAKRILENAKRMQQFINDLLQFSRHHVEADDFAEIPINNIVQDVLNDFELKIQEIDAHVNIGFLPVMPIIPGLARQLFHNLIGNSLKFRRKDVEVSIDIYAEKIMPSTNLFHKQQNNNTAYYKIYCRDNGIGFDEKYAKEIFEVFKRLHAYHEFGGTGLGLSICKKIVEKHNGFISASSRIGEGSTFIITLPEKQPHTTTSLVS